MAQPQSHNVSQGDRTATPDIVDELLASFIDSEQDAADPTWAEWKHALLFPSIASFAPPKSKNGLPPPISRLPNEIFMEVVLTLYDDGPPELSRPRGTEFWRSLMLVCKAWRAAIGTAPAIWRNIEIQDSERWFFLSLARAKGTTLNITLCDIETFCSLAPTLCRLRPLIRELNLIAIDSVPSASSALNELFGCSMDALERLNVVTLYWLEPVFRLDFSHFPRLRTAKLEGAEIVGSMNLPFTSRLCELYLVCCEFGLPLDLVLFIKGLSVCESLKSLRIDMPEGLPRNEDWGRAPGDMTAVQGGVTLPRSLRLFHIAAQPRLLQDWILPHVHFDPKVEATFQSYEAFNGYNDPPFTFRSIFPSGPGRISVHPLAILHTAQAVRLTVPVSPTIGNQVELSVDLSDGLPRTTFTLRAQTPRDWFVTGLDIPFKLSTLAEETAHLFCRAPVKSLQLRGNFRSVARETLLNVLRALPDLTDLALDAWDVGRFAYEPSRNESQWGVIGVLQALIKLERSGCAVAQDGSGSPAEPLGAKLDSLMLGVYGLDARIAGLLETYFTSPRAKDGDWEAGDKSDADYVPGLRELVQPEGQLGIQVTGPHWVGTLEKLSSENWTQG